ncbi:MAG TPA: rod shape-determining protein MreD [Gaiella sp.]|nr:rod shape-determining protein MreD [Gaiella sp.]
MSVALRIVPLVFVAAVLQVSAIGGMRMLGAEPDLLLVTVVAIGLVAGSIAGAAAGFVAGLLVDVMTLGVLGTTAIILTPAGYWAGRYGETTGRGRPYAPPVAAFALSVAAGLGGVAVHFLLGQPVSGREALLTLIPSALLAALLVLPIHRLCRALIAPPQRFEPARRVELV